MVRSLITMSKMRAKLIVVLLFALAAIEGDAISNKTLAEVTKFDDYTDVLNAPLSYEEKLRVIEVVWAEIRADYPEDIDKVTSLYNNHQSALISAAKSMSTTVAQSCFELEHELRLHIITLNGQLLAKAMRGKHFQSDNPTKMFSANLLAKYDSNLLSDIYNYAIEKAYEQQRTDHLAALVYNIYQGNVKAFEVMTQTQLHLYWLAKGRGDANSAFLFSMAYYFRQIKRNDYYKSLPVNLVERFDIALDELPLSLRLLFMGDLIMLRNVHYNTYLFTPNGEDVDASRRRVLIRTAKDIYNDWVLNTKVLSSDSEALRLETTFYSNSHKMYLYLENDVAQYKGYAMAWRSGGVPTHGYWTIQYVQKGDYVVVIKDGLALCASGNMYNTNYRYATSAAYEPNQDVTESCRWTIETK